MKKKSTFIEHVADVFASPETDPDGWYTGVVTRDELDQPVQDADDL